MTYYGHVEDGVVIVDTGDVIPEGTKVVIEAPVVSGPFPSAKSPYPPPIEAPDIPGWGLFADVPELMDEIVEEAMRDRQNRRWRDING